MRPQDIKIGEYYRFKSHPDYSYAKVIEVLKPKSYENTHTYTVVRCEQSIHKDDNFGMIRYVRPVDLVKDGEK